MSFTNLTVDPASLPRAAELEWTPMPPEHKREVLVQSIITLAVLLVPSLAIGLKAAVSGGAPWALAVGPASVLLPGGFFTWLALKRVEVKGYALREHDIAYRSGLFWRKVVVLPFDRVQHMEVSSGPLQRRFGLATLKFYTAGGSSVDLKIEGLREADAENLRAHILARSEAAADAWQDSESVPEPDLQPDSQPD